MRLTRRGNVLVTRAAAKRRSGAAAGHSAVLGRRLHWWFTPKLETNFFGVPAVRSAQTELNLADVGEDRSKQVIALKLGRPKVLDLLSAGLRYLVLHVQGTASCPARPLPV